jgi:hypothetical protein
MLSTLLCKSLQREVERCMLCVVRNNGPATRDCPQSLPSSCLAKHSGAARLAELDIGVVVGISIGIGISQSWYHDCSSPIIPTISANIHSDPSLSACCLDTARSVPLQSAHICLPIMSSTDTQVNTALPFIPVTLFSNHVQLRRREKRHPACCGHFLLPSRLYWRGLLSNWRRLQSEAVVRHYRHHLFRAQGIVWWHLVSEQLPWSVL